MIYPQAPQLEFEAKTMKRTRRDEIDTLLEQTADPNPRVRARAVESLCPCHVKRNERRVWDRVLSLTGDPALEVRRWVFHLLGDGSPREREAEVVAAMERFTKDADKNLRRRARGVLAQYRRGNTINVL
jgi:HEAT repeat protein